jgi:hypothetical protein
MSKKRTIPAKRGPVHRPTAKTAKLANSKTEFIGRLKGIFKIVGDIESPVDPPEDWEYD